MIEVNPEATPLSDARHGRGARDAPARRCRGCCSGCPRCSARLAPDGARPERELRDRHRHPRRQRPLAGARGRTSNPAPTIDVVRCRRWVWQLPNSRGQTVASARRCSRAAQPGAGDVLEVAQLPAGLAATKTVAAERYRGRRPSTAPASTPPRRTARCRRSVSTVLPITVTGTGAAAAAARACGEQLRFGLDGDHLGDRLGVVREVGAGAGADLEHPAGQPGQVLARAAASAAPSRGWT